MEEYDYLIKLIIIGESGVGKSSILSMYCEQLCHEGYVSTIGVDFKIKVLHINDKKVKLQIWDTAGQERFRSIIPNYYRGAHIIMLVFDLTSNYSFIKLTDWIKEIIHHLSNNNYKIILIGNKCDNDKSRQVNMEEIENFVNKHGIYYIEVSAKKNININEAFYQATKSVIMSNNYMSNYRLEKKIKSDRQCCF